jgi:hypothetical protein
MVGLGTPILLMSSLGRSGPPLPTYYTCKGVSYGRLLSRLYSISPAVRVCKITFTSKLKEMVFSRDMHIYYYYNIIIVKITLA